MSTDTVTFVPAIGSENAHSRYLQAVHLPPDRHPAKVYLAGLAVGSRRCTAGALKVIAGILAPDLAPELVPWHLLRYQHAQAVRAALAERRYAPTTGNKILAALRGVLREAEKLGLVSADDAARAVAIKSIRGTTTPRGRALDEAELAALRGACDREPLGVRDTALLAVLYGGGLRRSEAVALDVDDVAGEGATELRVHGKGNKARSVFLAAAHASDVVAWLSLRGRTAGPLFCALTRGGRIVRRRLSDQAVRVALRSRAERAGIAFFSPHDLRRTHISVLLDHGADISTVASMVGHSQVTTTQRYDRRGERARRAAIERLPH